VASEVWVARDTIQTKIEQEKATAVQEADAKVCERQTSPSHGQEVKEEEGGANPQIAST